uniref:Uncharacterized protein n=1 Tax=uncultured marine microorganism HF4000_APKG8C21 TaxID=455553 RepID=B3TA06_9ZZZZ|nr:hypothetical protein ALOHA_HF4000APKG8C21ctg1g3 [uncultured marine microorganism HF4000_APKG8C21]
MGCQYTSHPLGKDPVSLFRPSPGVESGGSSRRSLSFTATLIHPRSIAISTVGWEQTRSGGGIQYLLKTFEPGSRESSERSPSDRCYAAVVDVHRFSVRKRRKTVRP